MMKVLQSTIIEEDKPFNFVHVEEWELERTEHVNKEMPWEIYCSTLGILEALLLWGLLSSVGFYWNSELVLKKKSLLLNAKST